MKVLVTVFCLLSIYEMVSEDSLSLTHQKEIANRLAGPENNLLLQIA